MSFWDRCKTLLDRRGLRASLGVAASYLARRRGRGVNKIFFDEEVWVHDTSQGYFAYRHPYVRLDLTELDRLAQEYFFWGYHPRPGGVVIDLGAGVGGEVLTFSHAVSESERLVCIEAHPRTHRCLESLVRYNRLSNVIPVHGAVTDRSSGTAMIEDSVAYHRNRLNTPKGIPVDSITIDAIHHKLNLGRIQFLKMNIEGAERFAIQGMTETLNQTEVFCISCHDFLASAKGDDMLRTKNMVKQFFRANGIDIVERLEPGLPPHVRDQVWGYNRRLLKVKTFAS